MTIHTKAPQRTDMATPRIEETLRRYITEAYPKGKVLELLDQTLTQAHQAGIDEAVEVMKKLRKQTSPTHDAHQFYHIKDYNQALDDTIKALQSKRYETIKYY